MSDELLFRRRYRIPSARHPGWDYRWAGVYSVTICTRGRVRCLGEVVNGEVSLSAIGGVVAEEWLKIPRHFQRVKLDEWIVMPDHMHGILIFHGKAPEDGLEDSKLLRPNLWELRSPASNPRPRNGSGGISSALISPGRRDSTTSS